MIDVDEINALHRTMAERWHRNGLVDAETETPYDGILGFVYRQHLFNFLVWRHEEVARSAGATDANIASAKRKIDSYNLQRNDWIERIDEWLSEELASRRVDPVGGAPLNSETPGSMIDRLSILALRAHSLAAEAQRNTSREAKAVHRKLQICAEQQADLSVALAALLGDLLAGRKRHKTYRHLKEYAGARVRK
jgi:hypothetical protein